MTDGQDSNQKQSSPAAPMPPRKQGSSNSKWYAIIVVLVVIIAAFGVLAFYHPTSSVPVGTSAEITSASVVAQYNTPYNISLKTNGKFNNVNLYWGDGAAQVIPYSGSDFVNVSHTYSSPGSYYVYYVVNYPSSTFTGNEQIVPIGVSEAAAALPQNESYGNIAIQSASASPIVNNSWIYAPGTSLSILLGYFTPPANSSYQVVSQSVNVMFNGSQVGSVVLPYYFNNSSGLYELPLSSALYNITLSTGYYQLQLNTFTAEVNGTTGDVNSSLGVYNTAYFEDIPVFSKAAEYSTSSAGQTTLVNAEATTGGYVTIDPAIAYGIQNFEIDANTMATLVGYNGSSSTQFFPYLAAYLPTTTNGGINTNYNNYTVNVNASMAGYTGSYHVYIQPYENYTFHIRSNATFADGTHVTGWDVAFSFYRTLLFDSGSPGTPGWIQAQYLLPGNYYASNTFWNLTQNITWNNATNNVTFHFQNPMSPSLVDEILGQVSGGWILDAAWAQQHGGGIGWNASDFLAYQAHGSAGDYVSYLVNNIMSSGPYMIDYTIPASEVVLIANPNYNPPGNGWMPKASINEVVLEYIGQESTQYLQLKSGYAAAATYFPTSDWYAVQGLQKSGVVNVYTFPTIGIYWYQINTDINETILSSVFPSANIPQTFFDSVQVRRAFADAYNYPYYLSQQVGNSVYNTTFGTGYAGALPDGMLGYQSNASLLAAGVSLPQYNMTDAKQNWTAFMNSPYFSAEGLTVASVTAGGITAGDILYRGAPLNIPIAVYTADPVDVEGATTWGQDLATMIAGASFPVQPTPNNDLTAWEVPGQNPAPLLQALWEPDYPYPTDYMGPIAYPNINSFFMGPQGFYPSWFNNSSNPVSNLPGMVEQYHNLTAMDQMYANASTTSNTTLALKYFHQMNEELVNMTVNVYLYSISGYWVVSSHIPQSSIKAYQENVMFGGILLYDYISYS
ncbi:MAG: ABC transporter substrate-binding protein [Thermoplasmatales archaeon]|nr:ABC transporter substrate-binding protein [Thermoplasmatales archaeon]